MNILRGIHKNPIEEDFESDSNENDYGEDVGLVDDLISNHQQKPKSNNLKNVGLNYAIKRSSRSLKSF